MNPDVSSSSSSSSSLIVSEIVSETTTTPSILHELQQEQCRAGFLEQKLQETKTQLEQHKQVSKRLNGIYKSQPMVQTMPGGSLEHAFVCATEYTGRLPYQWFRFSKKEFLKHFGFSNGSLWFKPAEVAFSEVDKCLKLKRFRVRFPTHPDREHLVYVLPTHKIEQKASNNTVNFHIGVNDRIPHSIASHEEDDLVHICL